MSDALLEIQGKIVAVLKADAALLGLGVGVFDRPIAGAPRPYISFGPSDATSDGAEGLNSDEVILQIDCWSEEPGYVEVRKVAEALRRALAPGIEIAANAIVLFEHRQTRCMRDRNPAISHAVVIFGGFIERHA